MTTQVASPKRTVREKTAKQAALQNQKPSFLVSYPMVCNWHAFFRHRMLLCLRLSNHGVHTQPPRQLPHVPACRVVVKFHPRVIPSYPSGWHREPTWVDSCYSSLQTARQIELFLDAMSIGMAEKTAKTKSQNVQSQFPLLSVCLNSLCFCFLTTETSSMFYIFFDL